MLPDIELTPYYLLKLPITKKEINYRPYCVGEELTFLTHLESKQQEDILNSLTTLVKNCVKEKEIFEDLTLIDFTYILVHIRAKSKGEIVEIQKKCSKCDSEEIVEFDVINSLKLFNEKNIKEVFSLTDKISLELGVLPFSYIKNVSEIEDENQLKLYSLASSIKKIIIDGKIYNKPEPEEVIEKFLKKCTDGQLKQIVKKVNSMVSLKSIIDCSCKCGHKDTIEMDNILSFLS